MSKSKKNLKKNSEISLSKNQQKMEEAVESLLMALGEDPSREGLLKTPHRVANSLKFLTKGYSEDPITVINNAVYNEEHDEMIVVKDIALYSLCEHHLLPFFGKAHVAYIPNKQVIGLSKIARMVEIYARRLQVQERMTQEIASTLQKVLKPRGTAVIIEAEHLCMQMRGVQKSGAIMVTSAMLGTFRNDISTRNEFMSIIRNGK